MTLPSIYIPGAQKSGTTTLASLLGRADGLALYAEKEPMLMSDGDMRVHLSRYVNRSHLTQSGRVLDEAAITREYARITTTAPENRHIDASTSYLWSQLARKRIAELTPAADIIFVLRNPVDRFESALRHHWSVGRLTEASLRCAADARLDLLPMGHYLEAIRLWKNEVPNARFHFVEFAELASDAGAVACRLAKELGVSDDFVPAEVAAENVSRGPGSRIVHRLVVRAARVLRIELGPLHPRDPARGAGYALADRMVRMNLLIGGRLRERANVHLSEAQRGLLSAHYREANRGLDALTGGRFEEVWFT